MDKSVISQYIQGQEINMIKSYKQLIRNFRYGYIQRNKLDESPEFITCWGLIKELFDFLEYNKLEELKSINEREKKNCKKNIQKYELMGSVSIEELRESYNFLRKVISQAGYHDDHTKDQEEVVISDYIKEKNKGKGGEKFEQ